MNQPEIVVLPQVESDLRRLQRRYPSVRADLEQAVRLLGAKSNLLFQARYPGFGQRSIWKGRVINSDINKGKSSGYRLIWEDLDAQIVVIHIYDHTTQGTERQVIATVRERLGS
jgi:mRNA-degrading endonuclease RelE of RelBE toxin-antitoxin system